MSATLQFQELTHTMRPQDLTGTAPDCDPRPEHGGDYPDNMPQSITVTDAQGPVGRVRPNTNRRQDRRAGAGGSMSPVSR